MVHMTVFHRCKLQSGAHPSHFIDVVRITLKGSEGKRFNTTVPWMHNMQGCTW
jgi:hypothetical protein